MKLDRKKLDLAKARACMSTADVVEKSGLPRGTYNTSLSRNSVGPKIVGKIAKALGVDPAEIIKEED